MIHRVTLFVMALLAVGARAEEMKINPFFVMDNGIGRGSWTAEQQAQSAKELGFDGIGYNYTKPADAVRWREELGKRGLKLFSLYVHSFPDKPEAERYQPGLRETIRQLKGSDTIIWLTLRETKDRKKTGHDEACVKIVNEVADWAKESGLKVVIYPHAGFYVATAEEAVRIVKQVNRPEVGVTVNLCHELMAKNGPRMAEVVRAAGPHLMLATINGADDKPNAYIQRLDQGSFDVYGFVTTLRAAGYRGAIGLQCYSIKGDVRENLEKSMGAWRGFVKRMREEGK